MKFFPTFNGWLGKIADDFTFDNVYSLADRLASFYQGNSLSGQKLIVGYDTRFLAKEFAEYFSCIMASKGIKIFFGNQIAPSSVLIISSLHKKSMGTVVFTGDEHDAHFLGIRAYNSDGMILTERDLLLYESVDSGRANIDTSFRKWISKGYVEPFDPKICYKLHLRNSINFESMSSSGNRVTFNPLFGSGIYYFDYILNEMNVNGYSFDNETNLNFNGIEPVPNMHVNQLYKDMLVHGSELGFIVSPDCSSFEFQVGPHQLTVQEILYFLAEHFSKKGQAGQILLSDNFMINSSSFINFEMEIVLAGDSEFFQKLKNDDYIIAVDKLGRFYFQNHGAPDALLCGFYMLEILNNKNLTAAGLYNKLENVKESVR